MNNDISTIEKALDRLTTKQKEDFIVFLEKLLEEQNRKAADTQSD